jgi:hypothetical protein
MRRKAAFIALAVLIFILAACRSPSPPALGSGQVVFEETTVHLSVRDCIREAVFTEEARAAVEAADAADGLRIIFHTGPTRYLGGGYAEVNCGDAQAIPRMAALHRAEVSP